MFHVAGIYGGGVNAWHMTIDDLVCAMRVGRRVVAMFNPLAGPAADESDEELDPRTLRRLQELEAAAARGEIT